MPMRGGQSEVGSKEERLNERKELRSKHLVATGSLKHFSTIVIYSMSEYIHERSRKNLSKNISLPHDLSHIIT